MTEEVRKKFCGLYLGALHGGHGTGHTARGARHEGRGTGVAALGARHDGECRRGVQGEGVQ